MRRETAIGPAALNDARSILLHACGPDAARADRTFALAGVAGVGGADAVYDPRNRRLKLYGLGRADLQAPGLALWRAGLTDCPDLYTKLVVYGRSGEEASWTAAGWLYEGAILGYFADGAPAHLWSAFGDEQRSDAPRDEEHDRIVRLAAAKAPATPRLKPGAFCHRADAEHAGVVARLMRRVFPDYPTPIGEDVIRRQIASGSHIFRFIVGEDGRLAATASAEIDRRRGNAELTDCATRPDERGAGHMAYLLHRLAADLERELGITDLYTLARADEPGMNCVFGKLGFRATGRLVNNCRMPNGWESMNVWCRTGAAGRGA